MEKYIYIITNNINKKVYIGQTNNPKRREREHFSLGYFTENNKETKILYSAMLKHGIQNFEFSILEGPIENYNEREIFWIKEYNSLIPNGYNMVDGGASPPVMCGEDHPNCQHEKKEIEQIQNLLKNTNQSIAEIAKQFNYNTSSINRINKGQLWYDETIPYPIRVENTQQFKQERMENIIQDLLYTNLTQKEIANKYGVSRTTITAINRGQNFYQQNISYPIRKKDQHSKPIVMIDINTKEKIRVFKNSIDAERQLNLPNRASTNIRSCANGNIKSAYGYIWQYIN